LIGTCGNVPAGNTPTALTPKVSYSRIDHADEALFDPPEVHLSQGDSDGIVHMFEGLCRYILEHVLDREVELFLGCRVLGLAGDEPIDLLHVGMGEPQHGVDHSDVLRKCHV
jgi:hypothetical protein